MMCCCAKYIRGDALQGVIEREDAYCLIVYELGVVDEVRGQEQEELCACWRRHQYH